MELIIATQNKGKLREIKEIIGDFFQVAYSLDDLKIDVDVEETGSTFFENALIKAKTISLLTGKVTLADDSGLEVNCLGGAPGIFSARYSGENHTDEKNISLLLKNMESKSNRSARFVSAVVLYYPSGDYLYTEGTTEGRILYEKDGCGGFGYDPIFYSMELNKSFGIASPEEKNAISHRGRALRKLKELLNNQINL